MRWYSSQTHMPSALLAERDTAVPNRFFFSSNHPFCFLLLCFSMPHSVAYCVSLHASSWYFRHRKMMARSTVWLLPIPMMRGGYGPTQTAYLDSGQTVSCSFSPCSCSCCNWHRTFLRRQLTHLR